MRGLPTTNWDGRGYNFSPKVASTVGSFHHSITASCSLSAKNSNFPALPVSHDLKEYLSYHTIPGSKCQPILWQSKSILEVQPTPAPAFQAGHSLPAAWLAPTPVSCWVALNQPPARATTVPATRIHLSWHPVSRYKSGSSLGSSTINRAHIAAVFPRIISQLTAAST